MVIFINDQHAYYTKDEPRRRLVSPSTLVKDYIEPIDEEYWQNMEVWNMFAGDGDFEWGKKVFKDVWKKLSPETYAKRKAYNWKKRDFANYNGTAFHDRMERKMYEEGKVTHPLHGTEHPVIPKPKMMFDNEAPDDLSNLEPGVHPELLVHNLDWMLCGQIDYPIFEGSKVDVLDCKTDEKKPEKEEGFSNLKGGLDHLKENSFNVYSLKMSLYALMLEEAGWEIVDDQAAIDAANAEKALKQAVQNAISFGNQLLVDFAAENISLGITQDGMTKTVRQAMSEVMSAISTGSLYDAIEEIDAIPAEAKDAKYITNERLAQYKQRILDYLGV